MVYIAAAHVLSYTLTEASNVGLIWGVFLPETGEEHTHDQFSDDTKVIIVAKREYIQNNFALFRTFGEASGLFIKETGVKAFLISDDPIPPELLDLPFNWEIVENPSKVLGVFMGDEISLDNMCTYL